MVITLHVAKEFLFGHDRLTLLISARLNIFVDLFANHRDDLTILIASTHVFINKTSVNLVDCDV